jgi:predicted metal-binding protein
MTDATDLKRLIQKAHELGVVEAKIIAPSSVVLAPWVRFKCQFGCPHYGNRLCCPPYTPTWEETKKVVDCYEKALLFHTTGMDISPLDLAFELEQDAFFNGYYKALGFGAGPCWLCKKCNLEHCVHPLQARPSMESCGIDVYATVRAHGFPIEVVRDRSQVPDRYGLILLE